MNTITAWLSKLTDFVNLGQIVVTAGPGIVLALSLFVIATYGLGVPLLVLEDRDIPARYESGVTDDTLASSASPAEPGATPAVSPGASPSPPAASTPASTLVTPQGSKSAASRRPRPGSIAQREERIRELEREIAFLEGLKGQREARVEQATDELAFLKSRLEDAERQPMAAGRRDDIEEDRRRERGRLALAQADKAQAEAELQSLKRRADAIQKELDQLRTVQTLTAQNLLDNVLNHLILICLLGYLLGSMLSPLSRLLFVDWIDDFMAWWERRRPVRRLRPMIPPTLPPTVP